MHDLKSRGVFTSEWPLESSCRKRPPYLAIKRRSITKVQLKRLENEWVEIRSGCPHLHAVLDPTKGISSSGRWLAGPGVHFGRPCRCQQKLRDRIPSLD